MHAHGHMSSYSNMHTSSDLDDVADRSFIPLGTNGRLRWCNTPSNRKGSSSGWRMAVRPLPPFHPATVPRVVTLWQQDKLLHTDMPKGVDAGCRRISCILSGYSSAKHADVGHWRLVRLHSVRSSLCFQPSFIPIIKHHSLGLS